ncbi:hypothetical protein ACVGOW_10320 [Pseudonocardia saturnea]
MSPLHTRRRRLTAVAVAVPLLAGATALAGQATAVSPIHTITTEVHDSVGSLFTATNHLVDIPGVVPVGEPGHEGKEYLVVWAGDENVADQSGQDIADTPLAVGAVKELSELPTDLPGQDFLAVIDAEAEALVDVLEVTDTTSGGPHWGSLDNYAANGDGTYSETTDVDRIAYSNYFVARTGIDGNHRVCIADVEDGVMTVDEDFRDEARGGTCVDFNRLAWPHGETGNAKPHSMIFAVAGGDVR